jgi:high-affinity K+ transport system ATPase subunit B
MVGPVQHNVLALSGRAVEAAGDVDTLLLDKTGTITLGNRQATEFRPAPGVSDAALADAAQLASLADATPEGRSIVVLAKEKYGLRGRELNALNIIRLATPQSAILSAVISNAVIIIALIPLALRGITYKPLGAAAILRRNLLVYGLGGVILPFIGIKAIDVVLVAVGLA